ncbi:winged helix-turn-helix domain-containing protein [Algibacter lectus]|uniref:DNA-binding domain of ModE n=1 Tax=Algibacter lectus TaxID=221126 RepID=A0A090VBA3_9FLAO|nr:LysR family transcriptional regulator [Algibacter lectus]MWW23795.1 LysR family transcriptional regulator [Algibacter lectus]TDY63521.1 molybdate transport system regulatory protein [Algibacter lectus]SFC43385.1 molybdate transport system regulatory protein [Algibacter lectus]GAL62031.1 DNA-binding domain of ModE [Algibacter lectus]GAL77415.1 DNA-binding domain of modE / molybdate-binding domain of modE [Algibacter lectus]
MSYKIKSRIWIESENHVLLGEGRVQLLKAIETEGSLSKAAKTLGLSYKKAWSLIDSVNKSAKKPVTINSTGGKGGGGAELTDYGKQLIAVFDEINKNCWNFLDEQIQKLDEL